MKSFKCDRCGSLYEEEITDYPKILKSGDVVEEGRNYIFYDLCQNCEEDLKRFMEGN